MEYIMEKKRIPCKYPMSNFYNFEDEVPEGTRVSTPEECETCDEKDCSLKFCLIQESKDKTYDCEHHCPKCNSDDIEWGDFVNGDVIYQRGTCNVCDCEFKEYFKYSDTEIDGEN